ncbi:acetaldehyde dehydrogenase (acetylating) [Pseudoxanthomonas kalamensis DSM 18571]|uniref:acetaldehyde dehydrogenase (acetylating) n=1 Tax=Pseudoxanthomonas kalamensis TaxID=289483 RepID=UPI0013913685|nr:acetaldehyde dehydrogenase (acetylating) [Pseudoxanthomonas kalamensis]KAF1711470.1 acetaldehyde dehydrogenase (acetylating) [Pseudoxanthomonas kalamensis DSM 18571]
MNDKTKIRCAVIGSGNIGTDLIYKLLRSEILEPVWLVGIDPASEGLARARDMGLKTTSDGVDGLLPHVKEDDIRIAFDATSAYVHPENSRKLNALGVMMIDLTPAAIGPLCVPPVNLREHAEKLEMNVNMISCAGQATIPIVNAVSRVQTVPYAEIVASLSSKSIGPGTRANLDEFTYTTSNAIEVVGGAGKGKALAIINPAEPPMIMRNTIYCLTESDPDREKITASIMEMIEQVQRYVPGYKLVNGPDFDGRKVSVFLEVAGLGDYLPRYAGNLDIMTASAARTAEMFAEEMLAGNFIPTAVEAA